MRAVVFGCTGQDGSLLSASLLRQGYEVIGVSRSSSRDISSHRILGIDSSIRYHTADLTEFRDILKLLTDYPPDEIYNLSALSSVGLSFREPAMTFQSIVNASLNLLEVIRYSGVTARVFFAGSSEMYGNAILPITIDTPINPSSPYAVAKAAAFQIVRLYREAYGLHCITGVLFNHESQFRSPSFVTRKIIDGALRCASDNTARLQLGNLNVSRDWGWAAEYVEAMQLLLRADSLSDQLICTGQMVSLQYFVRQSFAQLGLEWQSFVEVNTQLLRPSDISESVGDPQATTDAVGWTAQKHVDEVIQALLEAARS